MAKSLDIIDPKRELKEDREEEDRSPEEDLDVAHPRSGGGGVFYLVLGIVAILVATGAALYILYKDYLPNKKNSDSATTASQTATATASASATTTASVITSPTATESTFKYTTEKIRIANGNGISGEGAKVEKELESKGFKIASVGNASKTYTTTTIYYKTGQEKLAGALKSAIADLYTGTIELNDQVVGSYDAIVVLGSK